MSSSSAPSGSTKHSRRRRSRPRRFARSIRRFWRDWRIEILIAVLVLLAVFLLVERMNIRQTLYTWLVSLLDALNRLASNLFQGLTRFIRGTTMSDLLAYLLLLVVLALVIWRTRQRLMASSSLTKTGCPRCGSDLRRIHRRSRDRVLSLFIPVRRYQCTDSDCRWRGLRVDQRARE